MKFIKLTKSMDDEKVWVNPEYIIGMWRSTTTTRLVMLGESIDDIDAIETPEEIIAALANF